MKSIITLFVLSLLVVLTSCDGVSLSRNDSYYSESNSIGGSLSSFAINGNSLYTINDGQLVTYDISDPTNGITKSGTVLKDKSNYAIYGLETIYPYGNHLFLGASDGMYIVDVSTPSAPKFISKFEHVVSCDPVVVQDSIAYVTLRGGNRCGQKGNELQVFDISDINNPTAPISSYTQFEAPYGLGVDGDNLFVCDNGSLKVFDCSDPYNVNIIESFSSDDIYAFDVIPYNNVLIVLGDGQLNQYAYSTGSLSLLSSISSK